uniref:Heterochromatin protein 1-binding protein 3 n=1 Tax=Fundulus heteroclitus TaxID=8078 RepID=A0A3Q2T8M3_FUNHE
MPIRRAPATPTQEKAPSAAAEKGEAGVVHPSTRADPHPPFTETCVAPSGGRMKDGFKYKKSKSKKVKRTIPAWASVTANKNIPVTNFAGRQNQVENVLVEAIGSVMKYMLKKYPGMELNKKRFLIKKAMKKHLEKGTIKQVKVGLNFSESEEAFFFYKGAQKHESLGDALPLIITRLCEPKEASYNLIKKYLEQHFPSLNIENRPDLLKTALVKAVEKGHLEQITGKGARGTFQLKRTAKDAQLKGSTLEDAITVAITAMNEPKTCSTTSLRKFLWELSSSVANLRRTLTKCKVLGWMEQITGHGFTGTYQLSFPFYPSREEDWRGTESELLEVQSEVSTGSDHWGAMFSAGVFDVLLSPKSDILRNGDFSRGKPLKATVEETRASSAAHQCHRWIASMSLH